MAKIIVFQHDSYAHLQGFRLYGKDGVTLLEMGEFTYHKTEFALQDGERVLGIKSRMSGKGKD